MLALLVSSAACGGAEVVDDGDEGVDAEAVPAVPPSISPVDLLCGDDGTAFVVVDAWTTPALVRVVQVDIASQSSRVVAVGPRETGFAEALLPYRARGERRLLVGATGGRGHGSVLAFDVRSGETRFVLAGDDAGFGARLALVGDRDGDGVDDFAVASPASDDERGIVTLASGADGHVLETWHGVEGRGGLGHGLCALRDRDGDGLPELVVSYARVDTRALLSVRLSASGRVVDVPPPEFVVGGSDAADATGLLGNLVRHAAATRVARCPAWDGSAGDDVLVGVCTTWRPHRGLLLVLTLDGGLRWHHTVSGEFARGLGWDVRGPRLDAEGAHPAAPGSDDVLALVEGDALMAFDSRRVLRIRPGTGVVADHGGFAVSSERVSADLCVRPDGTIGVVCPADRPADGAWLRWLE